VPVSERKPFINFDLTNVPETYVHRIGRTGRAGASGIALSFCNVEERAYLKSIQKLINQKIRVIEDHPYVDDGTEVPPPPQPQRNRSYRGGNRHGGGSRRSNRRR